MSRTLAVVALLLVGAMVRAEELPVVDSEPLVCTTPRPLAQVCPCMKAHNPYGDDCSFVGGEEVHGARLIRAGGGQQTGVYLVADGPGGWRVLRMIQYEQHHGRRESSMHPDAQTEVKLGAARVYRVDYRYEEDITWVTEGPRERSDSTSKDRRSMFCVLSGASGAPRCVLDVQTRCSSSETLNDGSTRLRQGAAQLHVSDDGTVTLVPEKQSAANGCLTATGVHHLW